MRERRLSRIRMMTGAGLLVGTTLLAGLALSPSRPAVPPRPDATGAAGLEPQPGEPSARATLPLRPTAHPDVPKRAADIWLVPAAARTASGGAGAPVSPALKALADGIESIDAQAFAAALPKVSDARLARTPVADYAAYYTALAQLRTGKLDQAREAFTRLNARKVDGVLREWGLLGEAQTAEAQADYAAAAQLYESAASLKTAAPDDVLTSVARTKLAAGQRDEALALFRKIYYDFPLSPLAETARQQVAIITGQDEPTRLKLETAPELGRAQRLFGSRRYAEALSAFQSLSSLVDNDERELVQLRIAEAQYYLGRYREAAEGTRPFLGRASRKAEARFFYLSALRGVGDQASYVTEARRLVQEFPDSPWAEDALNNLGTHYILTNDDAAASDVFREYLERFPAGRYAPRAAWKYGWQRYRQKDFQTVVTVFERAAATFPRSDYRPPWLYWSARAYDQLNQADAANARYSLIVVDYLNSYYGRLADDLLKARGVPKAERTQLIVRSLAASPAPAASAASAASATSAAAPPADGTNASNGAQPAADPASPTAAAPASGSPAASASASASAPASGAAPTEARIRALIAAGLYRTALAEIDYARRTWGASPPLDATAAWLYKAQGDLRRGINAMKRAWPQYLTSDADQLPKAVRQVIFPLDYWSQIRHQAAARGLDPFLVAALIGQESSFLPDARSSANALGLMQIVPATGRQLARAAGMRRFTPALLTDPDVSIRLGTLHFKKVLQQFDGQPHYALASYNAGESKVVRWIAERGTLPRDEFIDDIPYPETQNYVKRILGTAEDYRALYDN